MLILGDQGLYHGRFPWVTATLVMLNVGIFAGQCILGDRFTYGYSLVPEEIVGIKDLTGTHYAKVRVAAPRRTDKTSRRVSPRTESIERSLPIKHYPGPFPVVLTVLTSMFMHGDIFHLIGNLWFLVIFGRNVECALGYVRFTVFYLLCGIAGALAHIASDPHSIIPCLGASGAISGVMGAYVAIHPLNKIKLWINWWIGVVEVPALVVIGVWFLFQYIAANLQLESGTHSGVANWAHIGGFMMGLFFVWGLTIYLHVSIVAEGVPDPVEPESAAAPDAEAIQAGHSPVRMEPEQDYRNSIAVSLPDPFAACLPPRS